MAATLDGQECFGWRGGAEARLRALERTQRRFSAVFLNYEAGGSSSPAAVQGGSAARPRSGAVVKCMPRSVRGVGASEEGTWPNVGRRRTAMASVHA